MDALRRRFEVLADHRPRTREMPVASGDDLGLELLETRHFDRDFNRNIVQRVDLALQFSLWLG